MKIVDINAMQILDSRGNPTVQVKVFLEDGSFGMFRVPSGASTGVHEAVELRDGNKNLFHGKSVMNAVNNIKNLTPKLINKDFDQRTLDGYLKEIDGSENKSNIGANAILGISIAFAKASAKYYNLPLYEYLYRFSENKKLDSKKSDFVKSEVHLFANIINGGLHSGNGLKIQEFMILPIFGDVSEKIRAISEIYQSLKSLIEKSYSKSDTSVGDEGGFAPNISTSKEALDLLMAAVKETGYEGQIAFALDAAASDFYDVDSKKYEVEPGVVLNYKQLTDYYNDLVLKYPIVSIEDPMAEDDFEGFSYFMSHIKKPIVKNLSKESFVHVVGDDLLVTNPQRIKIAIDKKLCNSLLLKINQIGTLTESVDAYKLAVSKGWHVIVSHRSGETTDDFIADLCVGLSSSIKIGAPARGERVCKYNRLLNIFSN